MYTLIAFKPEKHFHDRGDWELLPARMIREDNLSREECIRRIIDLSTETPLIDYRRGLEPDCEYEEFHIIPISITEDIENDIWDIKEEVSPKIKIIKDKIKNELEDLYKKHKEDKLAKETEERRKKFLELQKEFATTT